MKTMELAMLLSLVAPTVFAEDEITLPGRCLKDLQPVERKYREIDFGPFDVCGEDSRTEVLKSKVRGNPYNAIASLRMWWDDGASGSCTGFLIGPKRMVTAGHCLARVTTNGVLYPNKVRVILGYHRGNARPSIPFGVNYAVDVRVSDLFAQGYRYDDWGIIILDNDDVHRETGSTIGTFTGADREGVFTVGYPPDKGAWPTTGDLYRMFESGEEAVRRVGDRYLGKVDVYRGMSGGPLLMNSSIGHMAVGLVSSGWKKCILENQFTRLNRENQRKIYGYKSCS